MVMDFSGKQPKGWLTKVKSVTFKTLKGPSHFHGLARRKPHCYKPYVSVINPCKSVDMTIVFRDEP